MMRCDLRLAGEPSSGLMRFKVAWVVCFLWKVGSASQKCIILPAITYGRVRQNAILLFGMTV